MGIAAALVIAYLGLSFATPAARADDPPVTTAPTTTEPAPDPAPPPRPAPKPAPKKAPKPVSKPAPSPVHTSPKPAYHAPERSTVTPAYTPTPTHVSPRVHRKPVKHRRKRVKPRTHVAPAPEPVTTAQPAPLAPVQIGSQTAAVTSSGDAARRMLAITGVAVAAFMFLLAVAVPSTAARFTAPGRMVMHHQSDLVLAGIATLLLTAMLFLVTSGA